MQGSTGWRSISPSCRTNLKHLEETGWTVKNRIYLFLVAFLSVAVACTITFARSSTGKNTKAEESSSNSSVFRISMDNRAVVVPFGKPARAVATLESTEPMTNCMARIAPLAGLRFSFQARSDPGKSLGRDAQTLHD